VTLDTAETMGPAASFRGLSPSRVRCCRAVAGSGLDKSTSSSPPTLREIARPEGREASLSDIIDWTAELRKIEREFDGLPPEPTAEDRRMQREVQRREREEHEARGASFGVYVRLALVVALGVAILFWPYGAVCGMSLFAYLASVTTVVLGGLWTSLSTWQHRMVRRHVVAIAMILWGLALGASQVLPRVGYAIPDALHPAAWGCG
jgi:hypothetical protein